jgi:DNA-binding transcriptional ArsR family regulator
MITVVILEKDDSLRSGTSNETARPEIERDIGTAKVTAREMFPTDKLAQILIDKENNPDESLFQEGFSINDSKVLSVLDDEIGSKYYSFTGLMRKLNLHQQSLVRSLKRLQDLGLIDRSRMGYKLTKNGIETISKYGMRFTHKVQKRKEYIQLLQTYVPINIKYKDIVHSLIGKWFNNLRWTGLSENELGYMLQWVSRDGSFQINLRIISDYVVIETNAVSDKEKIEAMTGSYRIFEQITKILQNKFDGVGIYLMNINEDISKQNN